MGGKFTLAFDAHGIEVEGVEIELTGEFKFSFSVGSDIAIKDTVGVLNITSSVDFIGVSLKVSIIVGGEVIGVIGAVLFACVMGLGYCSYGTLRADCS